MISILLFLFYYTPLNYNIIYLSYYVYLLFFSYYYMYDVLHPLNCSALFVFIIELHVYYTTYLVFTFNLHLFI